MKRMPAPLDQRSKAIRVAGKAKGRRKRLTLDAGRLFANIDPLPREVLDRWYRSKESKEWEKVETAATRAQAIPKT